MAEQKVTIAKSSVNAEVIPLPDDHMIGLRVDVSSKVLAHCKTEDGASFIIRFRSSEGFRNFMVAAMNAAAQVWPDIEAEWNDT